jgi:hypothetical protein
MTFSAGTSKRSRRSARQSQSRARRASKVHPSQIPSTPPPISSSASRRAVIGSSDLGSVWTIEQLEAARDGEVIPRDTCKRIEASYRRHADRALNTMRYLGRDLEAMAAYAMLVDLAYSRHGWLKADDRIIARLIGCGPRTWRKLQTILLRHEMIWRADKCPMRSETPAP